MRTNQRLTEKSILTYFYVLRSARSRPDSVSTAPSETAARIQCEACESGTVQSLPRLSGPDAGDSTSSKFTPYNVKTNRLLGVDDELKFNNRERNESEEDERRGGK